MTLRAIKQRLQGSLRKTETSEDKSKNRGDDAKTDPRTPSLSPEPPAETAPTATSVARDEVGMGGTGDELHHHHHHHHHHHEVVIAGAGIVGLVLALALAKHAKIKADLYEQASTFSDDVGAGMGMYPNGLRVIRDISPALLERIQRAGYPYLHRRWEVR
jgi:hypothetical protein